MRIRQNCPVDILSYGVIKICGTSLCDWHLTRIIQNVASFMVCK